MREFGGVLEEVLTIRGLRVSFLADGGPVEVVRGVSLSLVRGETLALVGESGCGKSVTALSILGLLPRGAAMEAEGVALRSADGGTVELTRVGASGMRRIRGDRVAMVFQEPMSALNPVMRIGEQLVEALRAHRPVSRGEAWRRAVALLERMGVSPAAEGMRAYPHQFSGGMRQRVLLAMALLCEPELLIADEPTTALDVTLQAQILELLRERQGETGMSVLFITHDFGVVSQVADRVSVMYAGRIVEEGSVEALLRTPLHPYTQALVESVVSLGAGGGGRLAVVPGSVPRAGAVPRGCAFHPRCALTQERSAGGDRPTLEAAAGGKRFRVLRRCVEGADSEPGGVPELVEASPGHGVACWEAKGVTDAVGRQA